jgi:hypothetical protein
MKIHIAATVFGAFGSIFVIGAVMKIIGNISLLLVAQRRIGTVVSLKTRYVSTRRGTRRTYMPVVEFQSKANHKIRITGIIGSEPPDYQVGNSVPVRFLTERPGGGKIDSFCELWLVPGIFFAVGLMLLGMAIVVFFN